MKYLIYSWNVNGIRAVAKKGKLTEIIAEDMDILCIQETKAQEEQLGEDITQPGGFQSYWHSAERKGYSGVATYYKFEPKEVARSIDIEEFDQEGRILITKYPEFTLLNVYFPNGKKNEERLDYKMRFYDFFLRYCNKLRKKGEKIIVCGDVNTAHKEIDLANPKANAKFSGFLPQERAWMDEFVAAGYVDTLRHFEGDKEGLYTWWSMRNPGVRARNVGWRLDYFFVSEDLLPNLKNAAIHPEIMGSDHCPVSIELEFEEDNYK
ncbi:MAG: exodeoxyribonuclease III [Candidatus Kariarchaeaceae archaeon]